MSYLSYEMHNHGYIHSLDYILNLSLDESVHFVYAMELVDPMFLSHPLSLCYKLLPTHWISVLKQDIQPHVLNAHYIQAYPENERHDKQPL